MENLIYIVDIKKKVDYLVSIIVLKIQSMDEHDQEMI